MKATVDRIKLFLLHSLLLNKLPLKYRAQTIKANLLDRFCQGKDGHIYPFQEVSGIKSDAMRLVQHLSAKVNSKILKGRRYIRNITPPTMSFHFNYQYGML